MKASCTLVASVLAAASSVALSPSTAADRDVTFSPRTSQGTAINSNGSSMGKQKYAPKFDGLRFIETLVTAHR